MKLIVPFQRGGGNVSAFGAGVPLAKFATVNSLINKRSGKRTAQRESPIIRGFHDIPRLEVANEITNEKRLFL